MVNPTHLELWNSVEKTDTKYTKKVNQRGGYTAISPQYQLKLATEQFGSYGCGFGLEESELDFTVFDSTGVVLHKAVFFYQNKGGKQSFVIHNAIQAKTNNRFDTDFAKKLETNTVSKALSKLGFNADVYMGEFDDLDYFNERNIESQIEHAANKDEEKAKQELGTDAKKIDGKAVLVQLSTRMSGGAVRNLVEMGDLLKDLADIEKIEAKEAEQDKYWESPSATNNKWGEGEGVTRTPAEYDDS